MSRKSSSFLCTAVLAVAVLGTTTLAQAQTKAPDGMPWFYQTLPDAALQGAWDAHRAVFAANSAISLKHKHLVGLAVSAQIPCQYCIIATTVNAKKAGATDAEIREAIAVGAMVRFWSAVLQGNQADMEKFKASFGGQTN